ncbi:MAG: hypothetical protein ABW328_10535 [Ilumatobacteraceae bacterium]
MPPCPRTTSSNSVACVLERRDMVARRRQDYDRHAAYAVVAFVTNG